MKDAINSQLNALFETRTRCEELTELAPVEFVDFLVAPAELQAFGVNADFLNSDQLKSAISGSVGNEWEGNETHGYLTSALNDGLIRPMTRDSSGEAGVFDLGTLLDVSLNQSFFGDMVMKAATRGA